MTPVEFDSRMGTLLRARPFNPFTVVLKDSTKIDITNPQRVTFRDGRAYRAVSKRVGDEFRADDVLDFYSIDDVIPSEPNSNSA